MTITNGYATLNDFKAFFAVRGLNGQTTIDASDDAVIEVLIEAVSRYIDRQSGRRFYVDGSDGTYYYQACNEREVKLPDFASITSVSADFSNSRSYTALTLTTDYELLPDNYAAEGFPITGIALAPTSSNYFPTYRKGIKIVGKRGWLAVPKDVQDSTLETVNNLYSSRSGQTSAGRITLTASGIVIRPEEVPAMAQKVIEHYRSYV